MQSSVVAPSRGRETGKLIALIMLFVVCGEFFRSWLFVDMRESRVAPDQARYLSSFLNLGVLLLLAVVVGRPYRKAIAGKLRLSQLTLRLVLTGVALGVLMRIATDGFLVMCAGFGWTVAEAGARPGPDFNWDCPALGFVILYLSSMGLATPVFEEVIYRGWLMQCFRRYGDLPAVLGTSAFFMLMHEPGTIAMVMPFFFGVLAALTVITFGSLWPALIAHITVNSVSVLTWYCLRPNWNPPATDSTTFAVGVIALLLMVGTMTIGSLLALGRLAGQEPDEPLRAR